MSAHPKTTERAPTFASLYREALRLLRPFWPLALGSTLMGALSGVATAALLATLNRAIHAERAELSTVLLSFAGLCLFVLAGETIAAVGNSVVGQRVIANLRAEVVRRVITAPIAALQELKAHRLLATLSHDVDTISVFTFNVSGFFVALAITLGCFVYLAALSPSMFSIVALAIALGMAVNLLAGRTWMKNYERVRDAQDELQKGFSAITEGAKELRINRRRRAHVFREQLALPIQRVRDHKIIAMRAFWAGRALGGVLFFAALGVIVALADRLGLSREVVSGCALVLLFVKGPLEQLVSELPALGQAQVAFRRVAELTARLHSPEPHLSIEEDAGDRLAPGLIELRSATYTFPEAPREDGAPTSAFTLGPIDLAVTPGEILFITGENGCGKTTLLMLLLGLYEPSSGALLLDGAPITADRRDAYRQLFSPVFFDYTLFSELLRGDDGVVPGTPADALAAARGYLEQLELAHKVRILDGDPLAFSTIELSAGQRKRLALVQAYLDKRPVLVFDEWAAEQDPTFRRIFYSEILPSLKRQGHTLIVISHDDRYFDAADRRITLRAGRILEEMSSSPAPSRPRHLSAAT